jgi:hypothetical protein
MSTPVKESTRTFTMTIPTDREIRIERIFNAPRTCMAGVHRS